ncbi:MULTISPECIES: hypothetical protein [unclassified Bradyrhizobium]
MSTEQTATKLDGLVRDLEDYGMLEGYAAQHAAATLVGNWKDALRDGSRLSDLIGDVDRTMELLAKFKSSAEALADLEPASGPKP